MRTPTDPWCSWCSWCEAFGPQRRRQLYGGNANSLPKRRRLLGAIVGEFFAGYTVERHGLGYVILNSVRLFQVDVSFAAILLSTLLGMLTFILITIVSNTLLARWAK